MHPEVCVHVCVCVTRASARVAGDARAHAGQVLQGVDQPAAPTGQAHSHGAPSFPHRGGAPPQREGTRAARRRTGPLSPVPTPSPHPDPPQDLTTDFGDGIKLIKLVENISEETLGKYHKNPTSRIQKIENINLPIKYINSFVASIGIKNTYSAENIIDQDKQFILGMVWTLTSHLHPRHRPLGLQLLPRHRRRRHLRHPTPTPNPNPHQVWTLILRFSINECSEGDMTAKEGLLQWAKKKVAEGSNGTVDVTNFHTSWQNGMAFNALINAFRPDLLNFESLKATNKLDNLT